MGTSRLNANLLATSKLTKSALERLNLPKELLSRLNLQYLKLFSRDVSGVQHRPIAGLTRRASRHVVTTSVQNARRTARTPARVRHAPPRSPRGDASRRRRGNLRGRCNGWARSACEDEHSDRKEVRFPQRQHAQRRVGEQGERSRQDEARVT